MKAGDVAAFPQRYGRDWRQPVSEDNPLDIGLTKREWFAGKALQGILASPLCDSSDVSALAVGACQMADRLIAELAK